MLSDAVDSKSFLENLVEIIVNVQGVLCAYQFLCTTCSMYFKTHRKFKISVFPLGN